MGTCHIKDTDSLTSLSCIEETLLQGRTANSYINPPSSPSWKFPFTSHVIVWLINCKLGRVKLHVVTAVTVHTVPPLNMLHAYSRGDIAIQFTVTVYTEMDWCTKGLVGRYITLISLCQPMVALSSWDLCNTRECKAHTTGAQNCKSSMPLTHQVKPLYLHSIIII